MRIFCNRIVFFSLGVTHLPFHLTCGDRETNGISLLLAEGIFHDTNHKLIQYRIWFGVNLDHTH